MLRTLLIIIVTYLVIRIALRLLLTESPSRRRSRVHNGFSTRYRTDGRRASQDPRNSGPSRFEHVEDAEFEEVPNNYSDEKKQ